MRSLALTLLLGAVTASVPSPEQPPEELHMIAVAGGEARPVETAADAAKISFDELWIWTDTRPPVRLTAGQSPAIVPPPAPVRPIAVSVGGLPPDAKSAGFIVAAPVAMWQSVPESLLPRHPLVKGAVTITAGMEAWRVRYVSASYGSTWLDVPAHMSRIVVPAFSAQDRRIEIRDDKGGVAACIDLSDARSEQVRSQLWARYAANTRGVITVPSLPVQGELALVARARGYAPSAFTGPAESFPRSIALTRGSMFSGRITGDGGQSLEGAAVTANGWITAGVAAQFDLHTRSGADGKWRLENVPLTATVITAAHPGRIAVHQKFLPIKDEIDTGTIALARGTSVRVSVTGTDGKAIAGAGASIAGAAEVLTDREGIAVLQELDPATQLEVSVAGRGYIAERARVAPPLPKELPVQLRKTFTAHGRFVNADGGAVNAPRALLKDGNRDRTAPIEADGAFRLDIDPDKEVELVLSSADAQQTTLRIDKGREGEVRDLGTIRGDRGLTARGRIISAAYAQPIAGVRIWAPQPSPTGELMSWLRGDVVETRTDENGAFALSGLAAHALVLRIEAPGFAPLRRQLDAAPYATSVDAGTIELDEGATVTVRSETVAAGMAKLDFTGARSDIDMLSAAISEGVARFEHVPAGELLLTVGTGVSTDCEKKLSIATHARDVDVRCDDRPPAIAGQVFTGDVPASGGLLTWTLADDGASAIILNRVSSGGLRQQRTYGVGPAAISIPLDEQGRFNTTRVRPGTWTATWFPDGGGTAPAKTITISAEPSQFVALRFDASLLSGVVVDREGKGVASARVIDVESNAQTFTDAQGSFVLAGLPRTHRQVRATTSSRASRTADVDLSEVHTAPLTLVLDESLRAEQRIHVFCSDGRPAAGAFVTLEAASGEGRLLTTDSAGDATATFPAGLTGRIRLAASHHGVWSFGEWQDVSDADVRIELPKSGALIVKSDRPGDLEIGTQNGWSVTTLYRRLGMRLTATTTAPVRLDGLPPGAYRVTINGTAREEVVKPGGESVVDFE